MSEGFEFANKEIVVGVPGGVAAYKAVGLCSYLKQQGATVHVIMTRGAHKFIDPNSFRAVTGRNPITEVWEEPFDNAIAHIYLSDVASAIVVVPATAHTIAKHATGLADDMLTNILLATEDRSKILFCPAMNVHMFQHPATQKNINELMSWGVNFLDPAVGHLACGYNAEGKLPDTPEIVTAIKKVIYK